MKPLKTIEKMSSGGSVVITAFGDSLTYGWMVKKGYTDFLEEMLKNRYPDTAVEFLNRGVPGDTAQDGLRRISEVTKKAADLVLVEFGLNDVFTGFSPDEYRENLEKIIKEIKASMDTEIALLTSVYINMPREYSAVLKFYEKISILGEKYALPVVNVHSHWEKRIKDGSDFYSLVQADGVHPTEEGYRIFAEAVMGMLK